MFGPMLTSGNTIFFPVEDDDDPGIPIVEIRRARRVDDREGSDATVSSIIQDVMSDPVFQSAIQGLRNPGGITVAAFLSNVGEARRARNASVRARNAVHEAVALVEGRGD